MTKTEAEESRETQVVIQMHVLDKNLAELEATCETLEHRLVPIIRCDTNDTNDTDKVKETLVPLAEELNLKNNRIDRITRRIFCLIKRMEI